ncbi:MAG: LuxR C-terminal-related transcriptional regulator [Hydrogenophaga sp.]|jgi:DNA-binding CsgD family transcriptional regulator|uniref:helix-turn-helix transcriptional regulator n=1 Tax=Hydrogenophaga sp. TaxID=1904254 RepID=UPI0026022BD0|nr:LuxR C-terminal-related transcriptional regulator [Hydrogenophaga sp.]MCV0438131.1 LuxR C-terminal-related transcriptional regulator [Hydrogenophaga sp.]
MHLTTNEQGQLAACFALLAQDLNEHDIRARLGGKLLRLFRADHFASFVWDEATGRFDHGLAINMDPANLHRYDAWYQYRDPITFRLQQRRCATLVSEVMPRDELLRCEFFNDFLSVDGLHWGINLHAFEGAQALGDLRIWRGRSGSEFSDHERSLLQFIEPAFAAALRRARDVRRPDSAVSDAAIAQLSPRETAVARCVGQGLTDKEIARELGLGLPSVRTYLQRVFDKLGVHRRTALARLADRL